MGTTGPRSLQTEGVGCIDHSNLQGSVIDRDEETKKADVVEYAQVFGHVGLLVNEPPSNGGVLLI